jgi:hypothetical protein
LILIISSRFCPASFALPSKTAERSFKAQNHSDTEDTDHSAEGHVFESHFQSIVKQLFNVMSNNVVSEINYVIHENQKRAPKESGKN